MKKIRSKENIKASIDETHITETVEYQTLMVLIDIRDALLARNLQK